MHMSIFLSVGVSALRGKMCETLLFSEGAIPLGGMVAHGYQAERCQRSRSVA